MQWSYGEGSPQGVELEKVLHPPQKKKIESHFLEKFRWIFF